MDIVGVLRRYLRDYAKYIIVILIVSGTIVLVAIFYSSQNQTPMYTERPVELQTVTGQQVYVPVGSPVQVVLRLYAPFGAEGELTVIVRKDIPNLPDEDLVTLTTHIDLVGSNIPQDVPVGTFVPYDLTDGVNLRSYFIKVYFNGQPIYDPTDVDGRMWVKTYIPGG